MALPYTDLFASWQKKYGWYESPWMLQWRMQEQTQQFGAQAEAVPTPKVLPYGAISWLPNGEPYYGSGLPGYINRIVSKIDAPVDEFNPETGAFETNPAGFLRKLGRATREIALSGLDLLNIPAWATERWLAMGLSVDEIADAANSPLPDIPEFGDWRDILINALPPVGIYNFLRVTPRLLSDKEFQEFAKKKTEADYQASRIAYSAILDPMLRENFVQRYEAGENPDYLVAEMANPWAELGGQLLLDPLNIVFGWGKVGKAARDARRAYKAAERLTAAPEIVDALKLFGVAKGANSEAKMSDAVIKLTEATMTAVARRVNKVTEMADPTSSVFVATAKRDHVLTDVQMFIGVVVPQLKNDQDGLGKLLGAIYKISSKDADEVTEALDTIWHFTNSEQLLGEVGIDTSILLRKFLGEDIQEFAPLMKAIKSYGDDVPGLVDFLNKKMGTAIDEMIPTVAEALARNKKIDELAKAGKSIVGMEKVVINPAVEAVARAHEAAQKIVRPVNRFLGLFYFSETNAGVTVRNFNNFGITSVSDEGFGVFSKLPAGWLEDIAAWNKGVVPPAATRGFGMGEPVRFMAKAEGKERTMLYGYKHSMVMKNASRAAARDLTPGLKQAGATDDFIKRWLHLLIANRGDTAAAETALRADLGRGTISTWKNLDWMPPSDLKNAEGVGILDELKRAVEAGDKDEILKAADDILKRWDKAMVSKAGEMPVSVLPDLLEGVPEMVKAEMSPARFDLFSLRLSGDRIAADKYMYAIEEAYDAAMRATPKLKQGPIIDAHKAFRDAYKWLVSEDAAPKLGRIGAYPQGDMFRRKILDWTDQLNAERYPTIWKEILAHPKAKEIFKFLNLSEDLPADYKAVRKILWDQFYPTGSEMIWKNALNEVGDGARKLFAEFESLSGKELGTALFQGAKQAHALADQLRLATYTREGGLLQSSLRSAIARGDPKSAISILAKQFNIASATETGVPLTKKLLNIINKYSGQTFADFDELGKMDDPLTIAQRAFEGYAKEHGIDISKMTERFIELRKPYVEGEMPSVAQTAFESRRAVGDFIARFKQGIETHYGETVQGAFTPELERALRVANKGFDERMLKARPLAHKIAEETVNFALHNYIGEKTYFDLALAYLMPYHFWYSRTYIKWVSRFAQNPQILAGYAKYRHFLEGIHAGMDDWWKYNINSNDLPGVEVDNPLFFNLEASLNPLYGLTGVDFEDPYKRVDWLTSMVDDLGKFGPSIWAPLQLAIATGLFIKGDKEAASRWGGRIFPQTATLKSITSIAGIPGGLELDPAVWFFSGGMDPYERRRVGRAMGAMVGENPEIETEAIEDARAQAGPLWEAGHQRAVSERAPGQLFSAIAGVGFKPRTASDKEIDNFYTDYRALWDNEPRLSPEEFRAAMERLRQDYPFMDTLLLARKGGIDRDRAYAFTVLQRVPPGRLTEIAKVLKLDPRLTDKFYAEKGHIEKWSESDRMGFMRAVVDIGAMLDIPDDATRLEWSAARNEYGKMMQTGEALFGKGIWNNVDLFFDAPDKDAFLAANPLVAQTLDWKAQYIVVNPLLAVYYDGIGQIENYWRGRMREEITTQLGDNIWETLKTYDYLSDYNRAGAKKFRRMHPEISRYYATVERWEKFILQEQVKLGSALPEGKEATLRMQQAESFGQQDLAAAIPAMGMTWQQWQEYLSPEMQRVLVDHFILGKSLPWGLLDDMAERLGLPSGDFLLQLISESIYTSGFRLPAP